MQGAQWRWRWKLCNRSPRINLLLGACSAFCTLRPWSSAHVGEAERMQQRDTHKNRVREGPLAFAARWVTLSPLT